MKKRESFKDPWSENERIEYFIRKYGGCGLRIEESERKERFFVIETDNGIENFYNWEEIPVESTDMEKLIREHLGPERLKQAVEGGEDKAA